MSALTTSSPLPASSKNKRVRFDEKVAEIDNVSFERKDEINEFILVLSETANETSSTMMQSVLSHDAEPPLEPAGSSPGLPPFSYSHPLVRSLPKDRPTRLPPRELKLPMGLFSLEPKRSRDVRCMDIINCALDCIEAVEIADIRA